MRITDKTFVAIDYCLTLDSGEEIDRSEAGSPLTFITGSGQIIPGLENGLMGMVAGESAKIMVEASDGYGPVQEEMFNDVPRDRFPDGETIEPGMSFQASGPHGPFMVVVKSVNDDDTVTVDLNHPLAGKRLHFDIKVAEVRMPSSEELSSAANDCSCGCGSESKDSCGPGCNCG